MSLSATGAPPTAAPTVVPTRTPATAAPTQPPPPTATPTPAPTLEATLEPTGVGVAVVAGSKKAGEASTAAPTRAATPVPFVPQPVAPRTDVYFANCDAARAAGAAPVYRGDSGYRAGLDRDNDGVGCE